MRTLLSLLLLATISSTASAQAIQRVEIADFGIYRVEQKRATTGAADTAAGVLNGISPRTELAQATTKVPGRLGVHFGFRYKIIGSAPTAKLKIVTLIPQPGIRNPNTGKTTEREEYVETEVVGAMQYTGYSFDNLWEIVLGTWTKEIWDGDRKLASQTFNVVKP